MEARQPKEIATELALFQREFGWKKKVHEYLNLTVINNVGYREHDETIR